jgi:V8-like Glu-specific endopeptidase
VNSANEKSCGTCFFFQAELGEGSTAPLLITNRHVIEGQSRAVIHLTIRSATDQTSPKEVIAFNIHTLHEMAIYHPSPSVDLAAIAFAPIIKILKTGGKVAEYVTLGAGNIVSKEVLEECRAFEELTMIGYPNGIWDSHNNRPIMRRASSATPIFEDYNGQSKFLIDCACFPGSSGSPVFLFNEGAYATKKGAILGGTRVALVGILHAVFLHLTKGRVAEANVATMQQLEAQVTVPNSIGICIKASELHGLIDAVRAKASQLQAA